jgi:hypothetical protein
MYFVINKKTQKTAIFRYVSDIAKFVNVSSQAIYKALNQNRYNGNNFSIIIPDEIKVKKAFLKRNSTKVNTNLKKS